MIRYVEINGELFIVSRMFPDEAELVSTRDGRLVRRPRAETEAKVEAYSARPVPDAVPFSRRPRTFLAELRRKRLEALEDNRKARRTKAAKERKTKTPKRKKKVNAAVQAKLNALPPELRAQVEAAMKNI